MAKEIERKFLVKREVYMSSDHSWPCGYPTLGISQGYLFDIKKHVGRIRITSDGKAVFTYKGPTKGISRTEVEFEVPYWIGKFLEKCCSRVIHKTRTFIPTIENHQGLSDTYWEVDEFHNLGYKGLIMAEIELPDESTEFHKPDWIGLEVSSDPFYYNSNLINMVV